LVKVDTGSVSKVSSAELAVAPSNEWIDAVAGDVLTAFRKRRAAPVSFPSLATRILDLAERAEPDTRELVEVISHDAAIGARLLKIANSPFYGGQREIETVRAAVVRLGFRQVAEVAVAAAAESLFDIKVRTELASCQTIARRLFHDSLAAGLSASWLARRQHAGAEQRAFMAGMLHDIGKPTALRALATLRVGGKGELPKLADREIEVVLERVHVEIGAELHESWRLPSYLSTICARHHEPTIPAGKLYEDLHVVRVASGTHALRREAAVTPELSAAVADSARVLGMDDAALAALAAEQQRLAEQVIPSFG
jgi:HD-like signal output (HDOD) protein